MLFDPAINPGIEDVERKGAAGQDLIMKSLEVKLGTQLLLGAFAQFANLELAELVAARLPGSTKLTVSPSAAVLQLISWANFSLTSSPSLSFKGRFVPVRRLTAAARWPMPKALQGN